MTGNTEFKLKFEAKLSIHPLYEPPTLFFQQFAFTSREGSAPDLSYNFEKKKSVKSNAVREGTLLVIIF